CRSLTEALWALCRHGLHLPQRRKPSERLQLDLPDTLAGEAEPASDLLQRLRLGVVEPVAQHEHLTFALVQGSESSRERLGAERHLDLFLRERIVAGDEAAEHRVFLIANRLVE